MDDHRSGCSSRICAPAEAADDKRNLNRRRNCKHEEQPLNANHAISDKQATANNSKANASKEDSQNKQVSLLWAASIMGRAKPLADISPLQV